MRELPIGRVRREGFGAEASLAVLQMLIFLGLCHESHNLEYTTSLLVSSAERHLADSRAQPSPQRARRPASWVTSTPAICWLPATTNSLQSTRPQLLALRSHF